MPVAITASARFWAASAEADSPPCGALEGLLPRVCPPPEVEAVVVVLIGFAFAASVPGR